MKLIEYLPEGAQGRIEADTRAAAPESKAFAFTTAMVAELADRVAAEITGLRAEIAEDRKSLADQYQGPHRKDKSYPRGSLTTCKGSLWLALMDTAETPGASADWRLVSKNGEAPK